jgi:hypothetical protein
MTNIQEFVFYRVGAASSREYRISSVLLPFIAAGSRFHKGRKTVVKYRA